MMPVLVVCVCACLAAHLVFQGRLGSWLARKDVAFWVAMWILGTLAARVYERFPRNGLAAVSGLAILALALLVSRLKIAPVLITDLCVAAGFALCLMSRPLMQWRPWRPVERIVRRGAGLSYSLYLIHLPVAVFALGLMEAWLAWPAHVVQPGAAGWIIFAALIGFILLSAWLFAKATEDNTETLRRFLITAARKRAMGPAPSIVGQ